MFGRGFKHISKDKFLIIEDGYDVKVIVKLLKKDMQKALREEGLDDSGKKDVILERFIKLTENLSQPKSEPKAKAKAKAKPKPEPTPAPKAETKLDFIPLEDVPQFKSKNIKINPFTRLEEAEPEFQSKNKIRKLPPLISDREKELEEMKNIELKQIIKEKGLKPGNKEDMIKKILESENIRKGVDWDKKMYLTGYLYELLKKQHYFYNAMDRLEKQGRELRKQNPNVGRVGYKKDFVIMKIEEGKDLLARDLQKEYETELARYPVSQPKPKPKVKPEAKPDPKAEKEAYQILYNEETSRLGKGFFRHVDKDRFMVETQGKKDIKNMKAKLLKADMQKAIKDSGLPLSSTGKKDEVIKNFIRLTNARTVPLKLKKKEI